jgi:hypothetical protein
MSCLMPVEGPIDGQPLTPALSPEYRGEGEIRGLRPRFSISQLFIPA